MSEKYKIKILNGKRVIFRPAVSMLCYRGGSPETYIIEEVPDDFVEPVQEVEDEPELSSTEIEEFNREYKVHFWRIRKKGFSKFYRSKGWKPFMNSAMKAVGGKLRVMYIEEEFEGHYLCGFRLKWPEGDQV